MMNHILVLLRHGESVWNKENKFTGWTDVELSDKGIEEATQAGALLKEKGFVFDAAFTSYLKRAQHTLDIVLSQMRHDDIAVYRSWRLNERHYGALQGLNKQEMREKFGEEKVHIWRRSFDVRPPELKKDDARYPGNDVLYKDLKEQELPLTESLKDTIARFLPYWFEAIVPVIQSGKRVVIAAHGNSLRALVKHLDKISEKDISNLNIPTGIPLIYELDSQLNPIKHYYLK